MRLLWSSAHDIMTLSTWCTRTSICLSLRRLSQEKWNQWVLSYVMALGTICAAKCAACRVYTVLFLGWQACGDGIWLRLLLETWHLPYPASESFERYLTHENKAYVDYRFVNLLCLEDLKGYRKHSNVCLLHLTMPKVIDTHRRRCQKTTEKYSVVLRTAIAAPLFKLWFSLQCFQCVPTST